MLEVRMYLTVPISQRSYPKSSNVVKVVLTVREWQVQRNARNHAFASFTGSHFTG